MISIQNKDIDDDIDTVFLAVKNQFKYDEDENIYWIKLFYDEHDITIQYTRYPQCDIKMEKNIKIVAGEDKQKLTNYIIENIRFMFQKGLENSEIKRYEG